MDIMKQASLILQHYREQGKELTSRLFESEFKKEVCPSEQYGSFVNTVNKYPFTLQLAMQIINRNVLMRYNEAISLYVAQGLHPEYQYNLFGKRDASDFEEMRQAKLLTQAIAVANNVYETKSDTPEFDQKVTKITSMLLNTVPLQKTVESGITDYKVISHISIPATWEIYLEDFNKKGLQLVSKSEQEAQNEPVLTKQK